jgi:hypothetical protein
MVDPGVDLVGGGGGWGARGPGGLGACGAGAGAGGTGPDGWLAGLLQGLPRAGPAPGWCRGRAMPHESSPSRPVHSRRRLHLPPPPHHPPALPSLPSRKVLVEYVVNDGHDDGRWTASWRGRVYERLLRKLLARPNKPAVVLMQVRARGAARRSAAAAARVLPRRASCSPAQSRRLANREPTASPPTSGPTPPPPLLPRRRCRTWATRGSRRTSTPRSSTSPRRTTTARWPPTTTWPGSPGAPPSGAWAAWAGRATGRATSWATVRGARCRWLLLAAAGWAAGRLGGWAAGRLGGWAAGRLAVAAPGSPRHLVGQGSGQAGRQLACPRRAAGSRPAMNH